MISWFHRERMDAVHAALAVRKPRTILDLGCGDGHLFTRLAAETHVERIVGIDVSLSALTRLRVRLQATAGERHASAELVHGAMAEAGLSFTGFDAAILVETIEHMAPDQLSALERALFGVMRPGTVLITTPNAEFNRLLGVPPHRLRHQDHRFEWGRAKFQGWAQGVADRNGYRVTCQDIAGHHPVLGGASQMAAFDITAPHPQGAFRTAASPPTAPPAAPSR